MSSEAKTNTNLTEDQLVAVEKAIADPHGFITRRFIEAIISMDGDEHNSYIVDTLKTAKSRGLDLLIKLLQTQTEAHGGLPTAAEAMQSAHTEAMAAAGPQAQAGAEPSRPQEPLRLTGRQPLTGQG